MAFPARWLLLAVCVTAVATSTSAQLVTADPSVVLVQLPAQGVYYPPLAASARVTGKVDVRVGVRPDGSVAEVSVFPQTDGTWRLLQGMAVDVAARASFECRNCTQPSTAHMITFVFSLDGFDATGKPLPPRWKQMGNANSEVTVFGQVNIISVGPPGKPFHVRAARCLWLWRCSKQAYLRSRE
jgi:TonB family protein